MILELGNNRTDRKLSELFKGFPIFESEPEHFLPFTTIGTELNVSKNELVVLLEDLNNIFKTFRAVYKLPEQFNTTMEIDEIEHLGQFERFLKCHLRQVIKLSRESNE